MNFIRDMDVAAAQGKNIDAADIGKVLGIPVVPMVAADKKKYSEFFTALKTAETKHAIVSY